MKKSKEYTKSTTSHHLARRLLIFLFLIFSAVTQAQEYDINDPRNPNCPCHKMQKLADDEFAQLNNQNNKVVDVNKLQNDWDENNFDDEVERKSIKHQELKTITYSGNVRKRKNIWYKKTKFKFINKYKFKKRINRNVALCYKWQ